MSDQQGPNRREPTMARGGTSSDGDDRLPLWLAAGAFAGTLVALFGTYWDDSWHTDRGRDDFFIGPHLTLYGGVLIAAGVVAWWWVRAARDRGVVRALTGTAPLRWATIAAGAVFVSAPVDDVWHRAFGRDAVLFSPPHLLAIIASICLIVSLASGLGASDRQRGGSSWAVRVAGAALVLGSLLVPVMEYEADVPQFSPAWFLPLVTVAVVIGRPVAATLVPGRWSLTQAAAVYTVIRLAMVLALAGIGFSTPIVPPVLLVALAADAVSTRRWPWRAQAVAVAVAVHLAYVPWLAIVPHGVAVTGRHLVWSMVAAVIAALVAGVSIRPSTGRRRTRRAPAMGAAGTALALMALIGLASPAFAHDPGQGDRRGSAELAATVEGRTVTLDASISGADCGQLERPTIVARRAGMTRSAVMTQTEPCTYSGRLSVPDGGRWFVYAAFDTPTGSRETWLPVDVGDGARSSATRDLYEPPTPTGRAGQAVVGGLLLALAAVLLLGTLRAVSTATSRQGANGTPVPSG